MELKVPFKIKNQTTLVLYQEDKCFCLKWTASQL
jgi:hypothetical protein